MFQDLVSGPQMFDCKPKHNRYIPTIYFIKDLLEQHPYIFGKLLVRSLVQKLEH